MFRLACDNDSHWFVIPVEKSAEWEAWTDLDPDDAASWEAPDFAIALDGGPTGICFDVWGRAR